MELKIKAEVLEIYKKIEKKGYKVYLVGGCVRDLMLDRQISDWDLTTNAIPEEIQKIFPDSFYDNKFGTVGIPFSETEKDKYLEITTFRTEREYGDLRRPKIVKWGKTIEEDLERRDFTINAIAAKIIFEKKNYSLEIVDPYEGQKDLIDRTVRAVRNPYERFQEDALRLMRAIRFAAQLDFKIEEKTWEAIKANNKLIAFVSFERIREEFFKILSSNHPSEGIILLDKSGILDLILPELTKGKDVSQKRPDRHHQDDVFTHALLTLKNCENKDPIIRFACLIHDMGKPYVLAFEKEGLPTFYNHEVVGGRLAKEISERFKLSKKQREKLYILVRRHMFSVDENISDNAIRRFIRKVGLENVQDILDLRIADRLGSGAKADSWRLRKFKSRIEEQLNPPFSINDLKIDGNDIMQILKIKPGPKVGKILNILFEEADEDLSKNSKEYLTKRIKELGANI